MTYRVLNELPIESPAVLREPFFNSYSAIRVPASYAASGGIAITFWVNISGNPG
jgi:hypothetical protein